MTRPEPRWIPRLVIEAVQLDQIREHGGLIGIRDDNALEAALARARHRWAYEPGAHLAHLAASYLFGICTGHPFRDLVPATPAAGLEPATRRLTAVCSTN